MSRFALIESKYIHSRKVALEKIEKLKEFIDSNDASENEIERADNEIDELNDHVRMCNIQIVTARIYQGKYRT